MSFTISLEKSFKKSISKHISEYVELVATKYGLDKEDLLQLWENGQMVVSSNNNTIQESNAFDVLLQPSITTTTTTTTTSKYGAMSVKELGELCKERGIKKTGKKEELINRLVAYDNGEKVEPAKKTVSPKVSVVEVGKQMTASILQKISSNNPSLALQKNSYGDSVEVQTGLVFDPVTKLFHARRGADGILRELTEDDIEICKKYKMMFKIPLNLDAANKTADDEDDEFEVEPLPDAVDEEEEEELVDDEEEEVEYEDFEEDE